MCEHLRQRFDPKSQLWTCVTCNAVLPPPDPGDWSDGVAPFIAPDMPEHFNISLGRHIRGRKDLRMLEKTAGLVPCETKIVTAKDIDERQHEVAEKEEKARRLKMAAVRDSIPTDDLEKFAAEEKAIKVSG